MNRSWQAMAAFHSSSGGLSHSKISNVKSNLSWTKYEKWPPPANPKRSVTVTRSNKHPIISNAAAEVLSDTNPMPHSKLKFKSLPNLTSKSECPHTPLSILSWMPLLGASDDHQTRHNETVRLSGPGLQKGSMPFATGWPVRLCALSVCISIKMCCLEFEPHGMPGLLSPVACRPASWRCLQKSQEQESLKPKHLKPQCHFNALINCKKELEAA